MKVHKKSEAFTSFDIGQSKEADDNINAIEEVTSTKYVVRDISIEDIEFNPKNTRFNDEDTDEEIAELAENIKLYGLFHPIGVFPRGDKYMLFSGERRTKAYIKLRKRYIPAMIFPDMGDFGNMERLYQANLQSRMLDAKKRFFAFKDLLSGYETKISAGKTEELAKKLSITKATVKKYKELYQNADEGDFELLESGEITWNEFVQHTRDVIAEREKAQYQRRIEFIRNQSDTIEATNYKTSNFIIPLIMQLSRAGENMIINDSSTEISKATYHLLKSRGYEIKIFNMLNPEVSDGWNFIGAVGKNSLLSKSFARMIIDSFAGKGTGGDPFWPEGMYVLMSALILLVNTKENNTIEEIRHILNKVDLADFPDLFEDLDDLHPAKMEFDTYLTSPVQRNVKSGAAQRLSIFNSSPIGKICSSDGINIIDDLATPGKKTAIFIVTSAVDSTFSFIPSLFLTAAAVQLSDYATIHLNDNMLPQPVHFIMDEFSNTGRIADIDRYLASTRKYGLVYHLIAQSFPQLYQRYEENEVADIINNSQYILCFGAGDTITAEFFEKYCGPTTVRTSMTQSQSVVLKNTDNFREGEQQRSLFYANEILTMDKHEYLLLTNGMPPLRLKKVFWKNLEDRRFVKDFQMKYYEPQSCVYRPPSYITDKTDQSGNNTEAFGTGSDNTFEKSESYNVHEPRYRSEKDTGKKPGERKKKTEYTSFAETPPMFQARYYIERPPINKDDIVINVDGNSDSICCFKNNKDKSGKLRQAILIRYNIDATAYTIRGTVPENRYVPAKTKLDLINLENRCNLYKEDCILIGWKCKYTRGTKPIEMKRLKINGTEKYLNENEQVVKSYSFILPKSDCEISPIFDSGKGTKKQGSKGAKSSEIRSTKNSVMKM